MQAETYVLVRQTAPAFAREQEAEAFDVGIQLMEEARRAPPKSAKVVEAARHMQQLWSYLIKDLSHPTNELSTDLKANLISIGLWVMKETDKILAGTSDNWAGLIDINRTVRKGLSS
ncbi:MAG: flagellar biosynthesis regulator FlaF [Pseudomonadota bacterium]